MITAMSSHICVRVVSRLTFVLCFSAACYAQEEKGSLQIIEVPETLMAGRLINVVAPKLPVGAIKACSNAMVVLKITIDRTGAVGEEVFASGYDELKEPALTAVKQWAYKPYEKSGKPVPVHTQVSLFFLGDGQAFPVYSPDGKGKVKGGNVIPLPAGCGPDIRIQRTPS